MTFSAASRLRGKGPTRLLGWLLAAAVVVSPAAAQPQPPQAPVLRVETGLHTAPVRRIAATADGSLLITASLDKTARVWSADGTLLRTLRMPDAGGPDGQLGAAAIDPLGRFVAVAGNVGAGWDERSWARIYAIESGRLVRAVRLIPAPVTALAFSPDGQRLALGFGGDGAVVTVDVTNIAQPRQVAADRAFRGAVQSLAFAADGRLAASAADGSVRVYASAGLDGARPRILTDGDRNRLEPGDVAFSPDGGMLAIGIANRAMVEILDSRSLAPLPRARAPLGPRLSRLAQGHLRSVAWVRDGAQTHLVAAGRVQDEAGNYLILRWNALDRPPQMVADVGRDTVLSLAALPSGGVAWGAADAAWGVLAAGHSPVFSRRAERVDFRGVAGAGFSIADDGFSVQFGLDANGGRPHRFDATKRQIVPVVGPITRTSLPAGLGLRNWENSSAPELDGQPLRLPPEELTRSVAAPPGADLFVLGTDTHLRWFRRDGSEAASRPIPATAWGVAMSSDGRRLVAALGDGTLRWFALEDGMIRPVATLFIHTDGRRWILWTPEGFFDHADEGGQGLAGFLLNASATESPDWVNFAQLHRVFYAPEVVAARLATGDAAPALSRLAAIGDVRRLLVNRPPPRVNLAELCFRPDPSSQEICRPLGANLGTRGLGRLSEGAPASPTSGSSRPVDLPAGVRDVRLVVTLSDQGGGIGNIDVFLNGRNIGRNTDGRGLGRVSVDRTGPGTPAAMPAVDTGLQRFSRVLRLDSGGNTIQLRAFDNTQQTFAQSEQLHLQIAEPPQPPRPSLHVLAIGVDGNGAEWVRPLRFAVADARAFAARLQTHAAGSFAAVRTETLTNAEATRPGIEAAFDRLAARVAPEDTVVIYLAGHGLQTDRSRYVFVPWMPAGTAEDAIDDAGINERRLVELWSALPARNSMLLLDTCHAGAFSFDFVGAISNESGRYVLAASAAVEEALDGFNGRNGLFAAAVLEGLEGATRRALQPDVIDNFALAWHVRDRVPQFARQRGFSQRAEFRGRADELLPFPLVRAP